MSAGCFQSSQPKALIGVMFLIFVVATGDTAFSADNKLEDTANWGSANDDQPLVLLAQSLNEWGNNADRRPTGHRNLAMRDEAFENFQAIALQIWSGEFDSAKSALENMGKTKLRRYEKIAFHSAYGYLFYQQGNYERSVESYKRALKKAKSLNSFKSAARHIVYVLKKRLKNAITLTDYERMRADEALAQAVQQSPLVRYFGSTGNKGMVVVGFSITEEGKIEDVVVLYSLPPNLNERWAIKAIRRVKYDPVLIEGKPVRVENMALKFSFANQPNKTHRAH